MVSRLGMYLFKESPEHVASRWILSCFLKLLCISIAMSVTKSCTWGGMLKKCMGSLGTDARGQRAMTKLHFRNVLFDSLSRFEKTP
jgi:hypothetical protein